MSVLNLVFRRWSDAILDSELVTLMESLLRLIARAHFLVAATMRTGVFAD